MKRMKHICKEFVLDSDVVVDFCFENYLE
jgi:hypothetical protein